MDEPRDFLSGLICGAAIGAAIGILFAPSPGEDMRTRLQEQTSKLSRRLRQQAGTLMTGAQRRLEESGVGPAVDELSSTVGDVKSGLKRGMESASEHLPRSYPERRGGEQGA